MAKNQTSYVCSNCGASFASWYGKCPECGEWEALKRFTTQDDPKESRSNAVPAHFAPLAAAQVSHTERIPSGITEVDRVLGGGFSRSEVVMLSGEPGVGKSTLLLSIVGALAKNSKQTVAYCSAEEEESQIALRAKRMGLKTDTILFSDESNIHSLLQALSSQKNKPALVVFDSLQTLYSQSSESLPGSVAQAKEILMSIVEFSKKYGVVSIVIGHITKDGEIAGPKFLEHMVDCVLFLEGEKGGGLRILRSLKNRYGSVEEVGFLEMVNSGMKEVGNPSKFFLDMNTSVVGKTAVGIREGERIVFASVEALVVATSMAFPKRVAKGIDAKRLELLLAILKKYLKLPVDKYDVYVSVSGGLQLFDPIADLGIMAAIYSTMTNTVFSSHALFVGEVGLLGQVRSSRNITRITKEAQRLGFTQFYTDRNTPTVLALQKRHEK
ncbi:MAG: DNA repair protein RadA [Candidatus Roizmanbacteria bacterium]|nr:DNA repair protein RadA [Candidatus Roizmanbacteria bacterium]